MNNGKENFDEWLTIHQICEFSPTEIFPYMVYEKVYSLSKYSYIFSDHISALIVAYQVI